MKSFYRLAFFKAAIAFIFLAVAFVPKASGQAFLLRGTVSDDLTATPIPGINIRIKDTPVGTATDVDGKFNLNVFPGQVLVVTGVGYQTTEVWVDNQTQIDIRLSEENNNLSELVVIGYGVQKREDVTGSITTVSNQTFKQTVSSLDNALQGAAAGMQVTQTSGQPGGGVSIRVRGGSSIQGGSEPLYVIDGFPVYNDPNGTGTGTLSGAPINPLAHINPADIESVDILKDASSTAIYGSRGANGVVIVTTKKGKADQRNASYEVSYGVQTLRKKIDVLNAAEFARLRNDALFDTNPELGPYQYLTEEQIAQLGHGTDWQDEAFRPAAVQNHQLSFNGGSKTLRYAISGNYFGQDGIIKNTDFKRFGLRTNLNLELSPKVKLGLNLSASRSNANVAPASNLTTASSSSATGLVTSLLSMPPTATVYDEDGQFTLRNPFENIISNPIASLHERLNKTSGYRSLGTIFGEYTLLDGLVFKVLLGADVTNQSDKSYIPKTVFEGYTQNGIGTLGTLNSYSWLNENTLSYTKSWGNSHTINAVAGYTQQAFRQEAMRTGSQDFVNDALAYNSLQSGSVALTPFSDVFSWALNSYLARVNYNYGGRYFLTGSIRADGSSRFGKNNKWGYFPSAALAWRVSQERFFNNAPDAISDLKVRVSYGATGNQEIGQYQSLSTLTSVKYLLGGNIVTGFRPARISNDDLGWETTHQFDAGIDLGLFRNRVQLALDVYRKKTSDLLLNVEIPWTTGHSSSLQNYGSVQNQGIELSLKTINLKGDFEWNTTFNFSINRNKVLSIADGESDFYISGNYIVKVGQPLGTFYGTVTDGILQKGEEDTKGKFTGNAIPKPGDRLYKDINNDGAFTTATDRTILGNAQADFTFGLTNNFSWRGFDLSFILQGVKGNQLINGNRQTLELFNGQQNAAKSAIDRWREDNPSNTIPRAKIDPAPVFSDRFIEDASFVRLRNLTLSYTVPQALIQKVKLSNVRFFVMGQNLLTLTKYSGYDPEVTNGNTVQPGFDVGVYPVARSVSGGIGVSF